MANSLRTLRQWFFQAIPRYAPIPPGGPPLHRIANTLSRFAETQATTYDNGATRAGGAGGMNTLERQVDRAMAQVLGRSPGRNSGGFVGALNDTFPLNGQGQVAVVPARSVVSMYTPTISTNGAGPSPDVQAAIAAGFSGQLSVEQANLYRQASVLAADAQQILAGLQPFDPRAEADRVEARRALIASELKVLVDEFGRVDEPRSSRVHGYLNALIGPNGTSGDVGRFGNEAYLSHFIARPVSAADEGQVAGFTTLTEYAKLIRVIWNRYQQSVAPGGTLSYTLRLARAQVALPILAESNTNFISAMDSIGFTEKETRSFATYFSSLGNQLPAILLGFVVPQALPQHMPSLGVNDLTDWLDRFSSVDGPGNLSDSGEFGLAFVTSQANELYWVLGRVLARLRVNPPPNTGLLGEVLSHERVSWAIDDLFSQLKSLADLAA